MATLIGKGEIKGLSTGAIGIASIIGYISPNLQTLGLSHSSEVEKIKGQTGEVNAIASSGDYIECEFEFIPQGSTIANARIAAGVPATLAGVTITGLDIIAHGPFTDALNTNGANTQPWIYEGGAKVTGDNEKSWKATLPLKRYIGITSATAIT